MWAPVPKALVELHRPEGSCIYIYIYIYIKRTEISLLKLCHHTYFTFWDIFCILYKSSKFCGPPYGPPLGGALGFWLMLWFLWAMASCLNAASSSSSPIVFAEISGSLCKTLREFYAYFLSYRNRLMKDKRNTLSIPRGLLEDGSTETRDGSGPWIRQILEKCGRNRYLKMIPCDFTSKTTIIKC